VRLESEAGEADVAWDETLRACGGSVFHSSAWSRYISRSRASTSPIRFRLVTDEGQTVGAALGFRTRSANQLLAPLTSRLWFDALPAVQPVPGAADRFIELLQSHAMRAGDVELAFGSFGYRGGSEVLRARGYSLVERVEFELDLTPAEADLWMALEPKRRRNINKSRRAGVVVEELPPDEGLAQLNRVRGLTWDRLERKGVKLGGSDRAGGADAPERELLDCGAARLFGARLDGEWLTVTLFTQFGDQVYQALPGHSPKALELQAPTLLLWESIARFRADGVRWFNLGGCAASARQPDSPEHGVYNYKKAFGGACLECASGHMALRPRRAALARLLRTITGR
jgi:hypothetical protein